MLTRQGKNGPGGAKSYIVNGKMTEGFAFVAYPAEYRSSGVMTFIVNEDGVVYQKDLGKKTDALAKDMKEYNPNSSWQKAEEEQEETAGDQKTQVKGILSLHSQLVGHHAPPVRRIDCPPSTHQPDGRRLADGH